MEEKKKEGRTGWTEAEMAEGFIEQPQPAAGRSVPDLSRREDLAGRTVRRCGYDFTYDALGYCVSAVKVQVG